MRYAIKVTGLVQGVGFRYYVSQSAARLGLTGWVKNEWDTSVSIEVQGRTPALARFFKDIQYGNSWIQVDDLEYRKIPEHTGESRFTILQ